MNLLAAVDGGIWGTLALTAVFAAARLARMSKIDYGCLLGELFLPPGPRTHALGLAVHLLNGIAFGLVYMAVLAALGYPGVTKVTPGLQLMATLLGGLLGLYHFFVQLPLMGLVSTLHAQIVRRRGLAREPEPFTFFFAPSEHVVSLGAHVAYGAVFGLTIASGVGIPTLVAGLLAYIGLGVLSVVDFGEMDRAPGHVTFARAEEEEKIAR